MARIPADRAILEAIYDRYHSQFVAFDPQEPDREAKILIPIDCAETRCQHRTRQSESQAENRRSARVPKFQPRAARAQGNTQQSSVECLFASPQHLEHLSS